MKVSFTANFLTIRSWFPPRRALDFFLVLTLITLSRATPMFAAEDRKMDPQMTAFMAGKRIQIEKISKDAGRPVPKLVAEFFAAAARAKWHAATNAAHEELRFGRTDGGESDPQRWQDLARIRSPLIEALGIVELYRGMNPRFFKFLGQELAKSIPAGSIYFGGSDEGRFLPTLFSESQVEGRPFFTLTQNALADESYLIYLGEIYGKKIRIATTEDMQQSFQEYLSDAKRRLDHDRAFPDEPRQLKPGEEVKIIGDRVHVNGLTAVMAINGLLVKTIFDKNRDRQFYVEESYPIDWMYPHLTPHQFIFKLNRDPLPTIPHELVQSNHELWTRQTDSWLGPWLRTNTPLAEVLDFVERIYKRKDLKTFKGDRDYVKDPETQKAFGRMRAAMAGLYAWHAANSKSEMDRQRLDLEAEYAFRQAVAIGPASPDAVTRYARRLADTGRLADARRLIQLATAIDPEEEKLKPLLQELEQR